MSNIGNKETMSKNLKYYIEKSGKSQREICEELNFKYSTFNEWVKGKKYPRIDSIDILADYFGVLKSDLIEEKVTSSMERSSDVAVEITIRLGNDAEFREVVKRNLYDKEFLELSKMLIELDSEKIDGVKVMLRSLLK